jgi:trimeric autotransporter adhesin
MQPTPPTKAMKLAPIFGKTPASSKSQAAASGKAPAAPTVSPQMEEGSKAFKKPKATAKAAPASTPSRVESSKKKPTAKSKRDSPAEAAAAAASTPALAGAAVAKAPAEAAAAAAAPSSAKIASYFGKKASSTPALSASTASVLPAPVVLSPPPPQSEDAVDCAESPPKPKRKKLRKLIDKERASAAAAVTEHAAADAAADATPVAVAAADAVAADSGVTQASVANAAADSKSIAAATADRATGTTVKAASQPAETVEEAVLMAADTAAAAAVVDSGSKRSSSRTKGKPKIDYAAAESDDIEGLDDDIGSDNDTVVKTKSMKSSKVKDEAAGSSSSKSAKSTAAAVKPKAAAATATSNTVATAQRAITAASSDSVVDMTEDDDESSATVTAVVSSSKAPISTTNGSNTAATTGSTTAATAAAAAFEPVLDAASQRLLKANVFFMSKEDRAKRKLLDAEVLHQKKREQLRLRNAALLEASTAAAGAGTASTATTDATAVTSTSGPGMASIFTRPVKAVGQQLDGSSTTSYAASGGGAGRKWIDLHFPLVSHVLPATTAAEVSTATATDSDVEMLQSGDSDSSDAPQEPALPTELIQHSTAAAAAIASSMRKSELCMVQLLQSKSSSAEAKLPSMASLLFSPTSSSDSSSSSSSVSRGLQLRGDAAALWLAEYTTIKPEAAVASLAAAKANRAAAPHSSLWTDVYRPKTADAICGNAEQALALSAWLKEWKTLRLRGTAKADVSADTDSNDSGDEDWSSGWRDQDGAEQLSNMALLYGCNGVGKTSAVYTCAAALGFEVIEVNASQQRSGAAIKKLFSEAAQSQTISRTLVAAAAPQESDSAGTGAVVDLTNLVVSSSSKHSKGSSKKSKKSSKRSSKSKEKETAAAAQQHAAVRANKLSIILFDETDVVCEADDGGFLSALKELRATAKCPVVLTTTAWEERYDALMLPAEQCYPLVKPRLAQVAHRLAEVAAAEGLNLTVQTLCSLAQLHCADLRRCLMAMQGWASGTSGSISTTTTISSTSTTTSSTDGVIDCSDSSGTTTSSAKQSMQLGAAGCSLVLEPLLAAPSAAVLPLFDTVLSGLSTHADTLLSTGTSSITLAQPVQFTDIPMSSRLPRVDSIEPSSLLAGTTEPLRVIITGANFLHPTVVDYSTSPTDTAAAAAAAVQVKFGEVWTSDCKVISDTEIEVLVPPRAQHGWVNVVVAVTVMAACSTVAATTTTSATATGSTDASNMQLSSDSDSSSRHSALFCYTRPPELYFASVTGRGRPRKGSKKQKLSDETCEYGDTDDATHSTTAAAAAVAHSGGSDSISSSSTDDDFVKPAVKRKAATATASAASATDVPIECHRYGVYDDDEEEVCFEEPAATSTLGKRARTDVTGSASSSEANKAAATESSDNAVNNDDATATADDTTAELIDSMDIVTAPVDTVQQQQQQQQQLTTLSDRVAAATAVPYSKPQQLSTATAASEQSLLQLLCETAQLAESFSTADVLATRCAWQSEGGDHFMTTTAAASAMPDKIVLGGSAAAPAPVPSQSASQMLDSVELSTWSATPSLTALPAHVWRSSVSMYTTAAAAHEHEWSQHFSTTRQLSTAAVQSDSTVTTATAVNDDEHDDVTAVSSSSSSRKRAVAVVGDRPTPPELLNSALHSLSFDFCRDDRSHWLASATAVIDSTLRYKGARALDARYALDYMPALQAICRAEAARQARAALAPVREQFGRGCRTLCPTVVYHYLQSCSAVRSSDDVHAVARAYDEQPW